MTGGRAAAVATGGTAAALGLALAPELRLRRAQRKLTDRWQDVAVEPRGTTLLGISFRPRQAEALGLEPRETLAALLGYRYDLVRLAAYWDHMENEPGGFDPSELDWQVEAAEKAGKSVIICTGAVKAFGYPEFFVPAHHARRRIPEGSLITPSTHPELCSGAVNFTRRVVERYRDRPAVVAWQIEHEAFDPLGLEHSWRLSGALVDAELEVLRSTDPTRPVIMNGFLPTSVPVRLSQSWRTRGQGDSLAGALPRADIVGIDFYPRHALVSVGPWALYLDGSTMPWHQGWRRKLRDWASNGTSADGTSADGTSADGTSADGTSADGTSADGTSADGTSADGTSADGTSAVARQRQVMVAEGQAEPWETVTTPPTPQDRGMASCLPEHVITNYNHCLRWQSDRGRGFSLWSYLFWGAEYWLARREQGDARYLEAFLRVVERA
jgi:hypothetical protein